jgi:hypothetical protein
VHRWAEGEVDTTELASNAELIQIRWFQHPVARSHPTLLLTNFRRPRSIGVAALSGKRVSQGIGGFAHCGYIAGMRSFEFGQIRTTKIAVRIFNPYESATTAAQPQWHRNTSRLRHGRTRARTLAQPRFQTRRGRTIFRLHPLP